jgi:phosphonate transport system ATP-binding protein
VGLARALLAPAQLWLVDEPLSALDPTRATQAISTLVAQAQQRGVTLVATLHQVDTALAHFPRIVGLRDGQMQFDLPAAQVSRVLLERLYVQRENELAGLPSAPSQPLAAAESPTPPLVVHCR